MLQVLVVPENQQGVAVECVDDDVQALNAEDRDVVSPIGAAWFVAIGDDVANVMGWKHQ